MTEPFVCRIERPAFFSDPPFAGLLDVLPEARVVGGAVRDTLAGRPISDVDLASPLPPEQVMARLTAAGIKVVPTGLAHGTVTAVLPGSPIEITTLRRDVETDGRHAVVAFTDDWHDDAARRDFTINAMSMTRDGRVFDYFEGLPDLRAGKVRFVGDPAARVAEDYLRVLRFFRFYARYGGSEPDASTLAALIGAVPRLSSLSVERIWHELKRILMAPDPVRSLMLMDQLGVLAAIVPEGTDILALKRLIALGAPEDALLRMAALLKGDPLTFATRMKLSLSERDALVMRWAAPLASPGDDDSALRRLLADTDADTLINRTWLSGGGCAEWQALRERLRSLPRPIFPLGGGDIVALGVPPGPFIGELLRQVRDWWLAGGCEATAGACREEARKLLLG